MKKILLIFFILALLPFKGIHAEEKSQEPVAIVIFGSTGDLTARKLMPAIYELDKKEELSPETLIWGIGRRDYSDEDFRSEMRKKVKNSSENGWARFEQKIRYYQTDFADFEGYQRLKPELASNRLFYLATPPEYFPKILENLHKAGLLEEENGWTRVVIEKPFGKDLDSALDLQSKIETYLKDHQVYRIDHYRGKEGVQKLIDLRFQTGIFEPVWNREYIDHVQITLSEDIGIGCRGAFWEETGLVRDLFQNHLMQLLTLTAMEPPESLEPKEIHAKKIELLNQIKPLSKEEMVFGQYGSGIVNGVPAPGYLEEKGVAKDSHVETYAAGKFFIENKRWEGVPFYIRAGKRLPKQTAEISIVFKERERFCLQTLYIRIQPKPAIFVKKTGASSIESVEISSQQNKEAYEKLLADALYGDKSLFVEADEQIASWKLFSDTMRPSITPTFIYGAGSWGPTQADDFLKKDGRSWQLIENYP